MCKSAFTPKAPAQVYCAVCGDKAKDILTKRKAEASYAAFVRKAISDGRGDKVGVGRGNSYKPGKDHPSYKNGISFFHSVSKKIKEERRYCESCKKDLLDATRHKWVVHHKDHNRNNNTVENFMLLCKRCHQLEHDCISNLPQNKK